MLTPGKSDKKCNEYPRKTNLLLVRISMIVPYHSTYSHINIGPVDQTKPNHPPHPSEPPKIHLFVQHACGRLHDIVPHLLSWTLGRSPGGATGLHRVGI